MILQSSLVTFPVKAVPLSEIKLRISPWTETMSSHKKVAASSAPVLRVGAAKGQRVNVSIAVQMEVFSLSVHVKPTTWSMETLSNGVPVVIV